MSLPMRWIRKVYFTASEALVLDKKPFSWLKTGVPPLKL
jgi:hypothetical protein